jgi:hypothetical protein
MPRETAYFRNVLRETNPQWTDADCLAFQWSDRGPLHRGAVLDTAEMDSRHPGGEAIGLTFAKVREGRGAISAMHGRNRFVLR